VIYLYFDQLAARLRGRHHAGSPAIGEAAL
jgi:hypothetical protein